MLLEPKDFRQAFLGAVRDDALGNEIQKALLVFVSATEADSVCAIRILQAICKSEHMPQSIIPVCNYSEMRSICDKEFVDKEAPRTVMLINCGSGHNIRTLLQLPPDIRITIIDSHRPIHTSYNNPGDSDTLFWHDPNDVAGPSEIPCAESTDDSDSDSDEDNNENESPVSKRQRIEAGLPAPPMERRKQRAAQRAKRKEERLAHHAQGTYWGRPASSLLYELAYSMQIIDRRTLWWHIVGVTDQLVHQRISHEAYVHAARALETQIATVIAEPDAQEEEVGDAAAGNTGMMRIPQLDKITAIDELRLVALRHWSLMESLKHSLWVAVRLSTWREEGLRQLQLLLVKCGLPLKQAKLAYTQMLPAVRKRAIVRLVEEAPSFGLLDFSYRSFQIDNGWNQVGLSASDVVVALTALLDGSETDTRTARERFWEAWAALSHREVGTLQSGLRLAKKLQQAIVMDGGMITDRRRTLGRRHRNLHVFDLSTADIVHRALLLQPVALLKLASFLHDGRIQIDKEAKPLVVIGPPSKEGRCLVVGFSGQPTLDSENTMFGDLFEKAAHQCNAIKRQDLFDADIVEIAEGDTKRFKVALTQLAYFSMSAARSAAAAQ